MNPSRYRVFVLVTSIVIACAVLFFFLLKPAKAPVDEGGEGVLPENPPAGVSVETLEDGERLVRNEEEGYEMRVVNGMYLYNTSQDQDLVVQDFQEPDVAYGGNPGCKVSVNVTSGTLESVTKMADQICKNDSDCEDYSLREKQINGLTWYEIRYTGQFVGSNNPEFITVQDRKIYTLYFQCIEDSFIDQILYNFSV